MDQVLPDTDSWHTIPIESFIVFNTGPSGSEGTPGLTILTRFPDVRTCGLLLRFQSQLNRIITDGNPGHHSPKNLAYDVPIQGVPIFQQIRRISSSYGARNLALR